MDETFDPDLILAIFKLVWSRRAERTEGNNEAINVEVGASSSKKNRGTTANASSLKVSCEHLRLFVTEAVQRAAILAEAEGIDKIEATHLERTDCLYHGSLYQDSCRKAAPRICFTIPDSQVALQSKIFRHAINLHVSLAR